MSHPLLHTRDLYQRLLALGAKPCHADRVLRAWSQVRSYDCKGSPAATYFPATLRAGLPAIEAELATLARLQGEFPVDQEVARLLVRLHDGQLTESVLLPRGGLCVSTQVGCAVGCTFCMSGRDGLRRHLGSAEIVAQVALARSRRKVEKVVFMGMGEPAHNLDNVMDAIQLLGTQGNIAHKNLVLSTVGDLRVFERLMEGLSDTVRPELVEGREGVHASTGSARTEIESQHTVHASTGSARTEFESPHTVRPALALSLHTTDDTLRAELLPNAPRIPVAELARHAEAYARAIHYPTQYQWTLIAGVNDSDAELERIAALLTGHYAVMNLIPFNAVDGLDYRRPDPERIAYMTRWLNQHRIYTRIRDSAGQEVEGACGQLRARAEKRSTRKNTVRPEPFEIAQDRPLEAQPLSEQVK